MVLAGLVTAVQASAVEAVPCEVVTAKGMTGEPLKGVLEPLVVSDIVISATFVVAVEDVNVTLFPAAAAAVNPVSAFTVAVPLAGVVFANPK